MQWTIKKKLLFAFGLVGVMLAAWALASFIAQREAQKTEQAVAQTGHVVSDMEFIHAYVLGVTTHQRAYLIGGDEKNLSEITALRANAAPVLVSMAERLSRDPDQKARWDKVLQLIKQRRGVVDQLNTARKSGGFEAARQLFTSGEDDRLQTEIEAQFNEIKTTAAEHLAQYEKDNASLQTRLSIFEGIGLLFAIVVLSSIAVTLIRSISRNVEISVEQLEAIAHKDLSQANAKAASNDELAVAIEAINDTRTAIAGALKNVAKASAQVATAGAEIESTSREISESTRAEQGEVERFASSLTEMNAATMNVAEHAANASRAANDAVATAMTGREVVQQTEQAMNRISETVREASANITSLGEVTNSIGEVVKIIQEIAGQTNLLALNAAIEAARAGEQGKGFAVVAQEVRQLAERTTKFTGEIANKIESVQQGAKRAVSSMQQGEDVVTDGVRQFQEVAASLEMITAQIESAQQGISMIASATTEQSAESEGLTHSINSISSEVSLITGKVEQSAQACSELAHLAASLQQVVDEFRLPA
jgi:methyl-accepting chemotaxis protein